MNVKTWIRPLFLVGILGLCFFYVWGCASGSSSGGTVENPLGPGSGSGPVTGTITTDSPVQLIQQTVGPASSAIVVNSPGSPLNGFEIQVPEGAYTGNVAFNVSYASITAQTFGSNFNPVTPLITIDNNGQTSSEPILIKVPASVSKDQFVMPFIYNKNTGTLEGLPIVARDEKSVSFKVYKVSGLALSPGIKSQISNSSVSGSGIIMCSVDKNFISQRQVSSNFLPGNDDWPFTNRGSFLTPGGNCFGQSITSIWFYLTQKSKIGKSLYSLYDPVLPWPNFFTGDSRSGDWILDSGAYRFVSIVQKQQKETLPIKTQRLFQKNWDENTWLSIKYAIFMTQQPQLISIHEDKYGIFGELPKRHVMVVYRADNKNLFVADPNFYGQLDRNPIEYVNGTFQPFSASDNADTLKNGATIYGQFQHIGFSDLIETKKIEDAWNLFQSGNIGRNDPDKFPSYEIKVRSDEGKLVVLTNEFKTEKASLDLLCQVGTSEDFQVAIVGNNSFKQITGQGTLPLIPGENKLGVSIWLKSSDGNGFSWVDFKWVTVTSTALGTTTPTNGGVSITSVLTDKSTGYVIGQNTAQTFKIAGTGFSEGVEVTLRDETNGKSYEKRTIVSRTNEEITLSTMFGETPALWSVEVKKDQIFSGKFQFLVVAPGLSSTPTANLRTATTFRMPIGDDYGNDLSNLSVGVWPDNQYPKVSLSAGSKKWWLTTGAKKDKNLKYADSSTLEQYSTSGAYHPGEDWNLTSAPEADRGEVVRAIANGIVLFNGLTTKNYGNAVLLAHKLANGEIISSFYCHMANLKSYKIGDTINKGDPIGTVDNTGPSSMAVHLHFEIRKASMLLIDQKGNMTPRDPIESWPATAHSLNSDNGKKFIDENFEEPSKFLKTYSPQTTAKTLVGITISPSSITVNPGATYDLSQITITAAYSDNSTRTVTSGTWSKKSGNGSVSGTIYSAPPSAETDVLTCKHLESGITKTADLIVTIAATQQTGAPLEIDLGGGVKMQFVEIPAGSFQMGEAGIAEPFHQVTLKNSLHVGIHEVTQVQYKQIMGTSAYIDTSNPNNPVSGISWFDALEFCNKLSSSQGLSPVYNIDKSQIDPNSTLASDAPNWLVTSNWEATGYRLPTEAEWEYACRGGTATRFYWGNASESSVVKQYAWYYANADDGSLHQAGFFREEIWSEPHAEKSGAQTVGQKLPNHFGLFDMSGNVYEWCWDWWGTYSLDYQTEPKGANTGGYRIFRGGSWTNNTFGDSYTYANSLSSAQRNFAYAFEGYFNVGFRVCKLK